MAHHNTTLWRDAQPVDNVAQVAFWPMADGWLCQPLFEHYRFSGDRAFLQDQAYPLMRDACLFYLDWLVDNGKGQLVTPVSTSPENLFAYSVDGDAFIIHNGERYSNRPLYCNHMYAIVLAGDKPCAMVGKMSNIYGNLMCALVRGGKGIWLQNASDVTSTYRPGRMEWTVKDPSWGTTAVHLEIVTASNGAGMVARASVENPQRGDSLVWASGAATMQSSSILWVYDMTSLKSGLDKRGFTPADCENNVASAQGNAWKLKLNDRRAESATGTCSAQTDIVIGNADSWQDPVALLKSHATTRPIVCGRIDIASNHEVYWDLLGTGAGNSKSPAEEFAAGMKREKSIENRVTIDTPDPWLNAGVGASSIVVDACYREGVYTHSGMRWSTALLGWRTVYGGTVFGWHDLVKDDAKLFIGSQITEDQPDKTQPVADLQTRLTSQAPNSVMFGKGHIELHDPHHYDMQSQFFDQMEHAWRWTGDAELEKLLKPSLDLDCQWIKNCYDPYSLWIYESYANTWPTDDQFYNGGGTSEETPYAYRAEIDCSTTGAACGRSAGHRHTFSGRRSNQKRLLRSAVGEGIKVTPVVIASNTVLNACTKVAGFMPSSALSMRGCSHQSSRLHRSSTPSGRWSE